MLASLNSGGKVVDKYRQWMYLGWYLKHFLRLTDLSKEFYTTSHITNHSHTHYYQANSLYNCFVAICSMLSKEKSVGIELPTFSSPNNVFCCCCCFKKNSSTQKTNPKKKRKLSQSCLIHQCNKLITLHS